MPLQFVAMFNICVNKEICSTVRNSVRRATGDDFEHLGQKRVSVPAV